MVVVAVAGGTGAVGKTIVKALVDSNNHRVFVLSRSSTASAPGAHHLAVDYDDVNQIATILRENAVDVVVSAIVLLDANASKSQINLIRGAAQSTSVTKFVPSEYHIDLNLPVDGIEPFFKKQTLDAAEELKRHSHLTCSHVRNGLFLDYLGMPFNAQPTEMMPWSMFVDLQNRLCVFPGDGKQIVTFTHSNDLAAFIERLIRLPAEQWPRDSIVRSNRLRLNDVASILQQVTGQDFKVVYDSAEAVRAGRITPLPSNKELFSDPAWGDMYRIVEKEAMCFVLSNGYDVQGVDLAGLFPDLDTTDITDFLRQSWGLRQERAS